MYCDVIPAAEGRRPGALSCLHGSILRKRILDCASITGVANVPFLYVVPHLVLYGFRVLRVITANSLAVVVL
jgi:hypothetical protein